MSPNPNRATTAGRVFNDLRNMARREGRSTDELLVLYVLERFLHRLSRSPYADRLVLKGGMLLAVLDARRSTRDADLLALERDRDGQRVAVWVREIVSIDVDDGVVFTIDRLRSQQIREGDLYPGVRFTVPAMIGRARLNLVLDVNFGDPVTPEIRSADFPQLLDQTTFPLQAYPVETVVAEKLSTMMALGDLNTRDRDWADLWRLTGAHDMSGYTSAGGTRTDRSVSRGLATAAVSGRSPITAATAGLLHGLAAQPQPDNNRAGLSRGLRRRRAARHHVRRPAGLRPGPRPTLACRGPHVECRRVGRIRAYKTRRVLYRCIRRRAIFGD